MKTLALILAGALTLGFSAAQAQDTTNISRTQQDESGAGTEAETGKDRSGPGVGAQNQKNANTPDEDYRRDMDVIGSSDVPSSLKSTLQGDQYKGWEQNSTIYSGRNRDSFILEMREGTQTKVHRFDKDGKPVQEK
jgi:hypothetical protein